MAETPELTEPSYEKKEPRLKRKQNSEPVLDLDANSKKDDVTNRTEGLDWGLTFSKDLHWDWYKGSSNF